ncbi:Na+/H+ antiporter subunit A [Actinomyces minihominis]|uniref:Na+/H+ antiporter subunit A n=1 Tax=Actinomyces minihominis TaxID=2002838 RepID=UPI000C075C08|nr:Na+/H+ antiporter subunit A [Actinomyces minihominis]
MIELLIVQLIAVLCAPLAVRLWGRNGFLVLALAPASVVVWAILQAPAVFQEQRFESFQWVPALGLEFVFRLDVLSWVMMLLVSGVGALVLVYSSRYFSRSAGSLGRFATFFMAFSAAMYGVVVSDQTMMMYVFWELTAVLSYLLIGHHSTRRPARAAARQAFLITGFGGLVMFSGLVMFGMAPGGSFRSSVLIERFQDGTLQANQPLFIVAALLVLVGGLSKSAQVPFSFWLPGAMAAPTPVSAYLHAAAMVKAGVYLIARFTPGFTLIPGWSAVAVTLGLYTMLHASYRALRQRDLKLILAYGTVSQLGLMIAAVGFGTAATLTAGLVIMIAHALFKSSLFLTVGAVESSTGTRDLWELSGLRKRMPLLAGFAGLAALSMAGIPVTLGYVGKESLLAGLLHGSSPHLPSGTGFGWLIVVIVALGSMMTMAYAWRFWWGAFGTKKILVDLQVRPLSQLMMVPIGVLASGALLGIVAQLFDHLLNAPTGPALGMPGEAHIALWSGLAPALVTAVIIAGGLTLIYLRPQVSKLQRALETPISAARLFAASISELELIASRVTSLFQRGSLPAEVGTIVMSAAVLTGYGILRTNPPRDLPPLWDSSLQAAIVVVGVVATIATVRSRRRVRAALSLGAVGMSVSLLFAIHGAPDLALTQLAVEAVSIVVFILVLRKLPTFFSTRPLVSSKISRLIVGISAGIITSLGGYYAFSARIHQPVSELMPREALEFGHGRNIVNVILVDIRAWDTMGELSVLLVTATGVASLIYVMSRTGRIDRITKRSAKPGRFLPGATAQRPHDRSLVLEVSTRLLFPTMIVLSIWLLLIGHNNPGGGFVGGVVAGLAFVLRYLAGGRYELGEAMPIPAGYLLGTGLFVAAAGGALPLLYGNVPFQSTPVDIPLGPLGELHFTTAMILDIGVYILVLGLIIDLVAALGAEVDRQGDPSSRSYGSVGA